MGDVDYKNYPNGMFIYDISNTLYYRGHYNYGACGIKNISNKDRSFDISLVTINNISDSKIDHISLKYNHTLLCTTDNRVFASGINKTDEVQYYFYDTGNSNIISEIDISKFNSLNYTNPVQGMINDTSYCDEFIEITKYLNHHMNNEDVNKVFTTYLGSFFITTNYKVYTCGYNKYYQLGLFNKQNFEIPTQIDFPSNVYIKDIQCGYYFTAFLSTYGEVYITGKITNTSIPIMFPTEFEFIDPNVKFRSIQANGETLILRDIDYKLYILGRNVFDSRIYNTITYLHENSSFNLSDITPLYSNINYVYLYSDDKYIISDLSGIDNDTKYKYYSNDINSDISFDISVSYEKISLLYENDKNDQNKVSSFNLFSYDGSYCYQFKYDDDNFEKNDITENITDSDVDLSNIQFLTNEIKHRNKNEIFDNVVIKEVKLLNTNNYNDISSSDGILYHSQSIYLLDNGYIHYNESEFPNNDTSFNHYIKQYNQEYKDDFNQIVDIQSNFYQIVFVKEYLSRNKEVFVYDLIDNSFQKIDTLMNVPDKINSLQINFTKYSVSIGIENNSSFTDGTYNNEFKIYSYGNPLYYSYKKIRSFNVTKPIEDIFTMYSNNHAFVIIYKNASDKYTIKDVFGHPLYGGNMNIQNSNFNDLDTLNIKYTNTSFLMEYKLTSTDNMKCYIWGIHNHDYIYDSSFSFHRRLK
jgi:hypothetical protein